MYYAYKTSFDRSFKQFLPAERRQIQIACDTLFAYLEKRSALLPQGLGLKRIGHDYWEIRVGLKLRILFAISRDCVTFYFVGNHDQIHRFVRG